MSSAHIIPFDPSCIIPCELRGQHYMSSALHYMKGMWYGVATVSRIDKIIGHFCRIASLL